MRDTDNAAEARSLPSAILHGWDNFWFSPQDPTTLAFMRICAGLLVFYVHLTYSWGLFGYIGPEAWLDKPTADYLQREVPVFSLTFDWGDQFVPISKGNYCWSIFFHVTSPGWIIALHVFFLTCMLLFAVGLWTRWMAVLTWLGAMSYVQRASSTVFGLDTMMMIGLLYLLIGPSGACLSVDRWLEKRRARRRGEPIPEVKPSYAANFAIRLTQVHFCVIYLASGTSKMLGVTWWNGTAMDLVLLNTSFAPMENEVYYRTIKLLTGHRLLWAIVTTAGIAYTLFLEIGFPFLVWYRSTRWVMICGAVLLHTGIGLFMGLSTFSLMMMVLVLSFIPPEQIKALVAVLEDTAKRLFAPRAAAAVKKGELVLTR